MVDILNNIQVFFKIWGTNPLVVALTTFVFTLLVTKLFPSIWTLLKSLTSWLIVKLRGKGSEHTFEQAYLNWLIGQHRHLGLLPAQSVVRRWGERQQYVELEDVYITLPVSSRSGDENRARTYEETENSWRSRPRNVSWWNATSIGASTIIIIAIPIIFSVFPALFEKLVFFLPPFLKTSTVVSFVYVCFVTWYLFLSVRIRTSRKRSNELGGLDSLINEHKRLIIRGDPGSGKTTVLRYLAVTSARTLRKNKADGDSSRLVKERLLWDIDPFPIFVTLRRHGKVANWNEDRGLIDTFLEEMPPELRRLCPKEFFAQKLHKGNCLILLDGFDELGAPEARAAMAQRISGFLEVYEGLSNRVIVTTRIVGYEGQLDRYDFDICTLQNLGAGEVRALVKQRYKAIILNETIGRRQQEAEDIRQRLSRRSERLIEKIENTSRLSQLATNPMLLSLIVLIHFLKVELPEERTLLYRDCVEILTERWQSIKLQDAGIQRDENQELTLSQKLVLLREIAFAMQQQRIEEGSPAVMPRDTVRDLIAEKLPGFLSVEMSQNENVRREIYRSKAEEWINGILVQSGILVEQGLDETGEPVIGFSHLTFQEYLAAVALNEVEEYRPLLWHNLMKPAWREVALLYVALASNATSVIVTLLESPLQPEGTLLAGYCLAERIKDVKNEVRLLVLTKIKDGFSHADATISADFGKVMAAVGGDEVTAFMRMQLDGLPSTKRLVAIRTLGQAKSGGLELEATQSKLVQILETMSNEVDTTIATREALAQIGDPRFNGPEPILVRIPQQTAGATTSPKKLKELTVSPEWARAKGFRRRFALVLRCLDAWLFFTWRSIRHQQADSSELEIGKFPVTNIEYSRFVNATGHPAPSHWIEGLFSLKQATHPVINISFSDANDYCIWLSQQTGKRYRLPTEWEWEWAAAGQQRRKYPWGDSFDKDKCNTKESSINKTTPVGSYIVGESQFEVSDMSGNIWEITTGRMIFSPFRGSEAVPNLTITLLGTALLFIVLLIPLGIISLFHFFINPLKVDGFISLYISIDIILSIMVWSCFLLWDSTLMDGPVLRGGAWDRSSDQATCFYRLNGEEWDSVLAKGFRCARDL